MQCPKCKNVSLSDGTLAGMSVKQCLECKGTWLPADEYEAWQLRQSYQTPGDRLDEALYVDFVQSPLDTKAALCPECRRYLARAKVSVKTPFYVERCTECSGIWCDYGEWDILQKLGLHTTIQQLFSNNWQTYAREVQQAEKERQATIDKLGVDLATQVFAIADALQQHPNGDFGVAYLMRRVTEGQTPPMQESKQDYH